MTKQERIGYLLCTLASFISGFIIFAFVGVKGPWAPESMSETKVFAIFGLLGGLAVAVTLSGIILTAWVVRESSMIFKVIMGLLWPVTAACVVCVGVVTFIPYEIFNFVRIFMYKDKKHTADVPVPLHAKDDKKIKSEKEAKEV